MQPAQAYVLLVVLVTLLVACSPGDGESDQGVGGNSVPAAPQGTTPKAKDAGSNPEDGATADDTPAGWDYVALGDSLAAGVGASRGYVARYAEHLRSDAGVRVEVRNLGISGQTSSQLLQALRKDPSVREALGEAEVVTLNIGINDLGWAGRSYQSGTCGGPQNERCLREALRKFQGNWDAIVGEITSLGPTDETIVRTAGLGYTPRAGDVFGSYLGEANRYIASSAQKAGISHTEVHLGNGKITPDGIHPNDRGYGEIASRLRGLGYEPLISRREG